MDNSKNTQLFIIGLLAVAVLAMSVGFAAFVQDLNINGAADVKAASWNVQFKTGAGAVTDSTIGTAEAKTAPTVNATTLTFSANLKKPGDKYTVNATVENTGTFDAKLTGLTMTSLSADQQKYLRYTVSVGGNTYETNQTNLNVALAQLTGTHPVVVTVEYLQPANATDLPATDQAITLTATLNYAQAE